MRKNSYVNRHCHVRPIDLCISSRGIGFGVSQIVSKLRCCLHNRMKNDNDTIIYELYRVSLAALQSKFQIDYLKFHTNDDSEIIESSLPYGSFCFNQEDDFNFKNLMFLPNEIKRIINAVGDLEIHGKHYRAKIAGNKYFDLEEEKRIIPKSEHVYYYNLRETVMALSDDTTNIDMRQKFYNNNPIPGAIWEITDNGPLLKNADEIMPHNFTKLNEDYQKVNNLFSLYVQPREPQYFDEKLNCNREFTGDKTQLICNNQNNMKITDRKPGEPLCDYCRRIEIQGDIDSFGNLEFLTEKQVIMGSLNLLGERPVDPNHTDPLYFSRDDRLCFQRSFETYRDCCGESSSKDLSRMSSYQVVDYSSSD